MPRIFKVVVKTELYFFGSEPPEDDELADAVKTEIEMGNAHTIAESVESVDQISEDWKQACPYGEGGNAKTVAEWFLKI